MGLTESFLTHVLETRGLVQMSAATQELSPQVAGLPGSERFTGHRLESTKVVLESLLALVILVPAMPIILLAVFLVRITSPGPVIYTQKRLGRQGRLFTIYKIRTMYQNSEPDGPRWSLPGDPRVTLIGHFLRWCHIDELPQLFNVLRGEMSLIGPRPERPEIVAELERAFPEYRRRLLVRPGVTGLAQVLQAPDKDLGMVRSKLYFDLYYLDHWSLWLDIRIMMATVLHMLHIPAATIARVFEFPSASPGFQEGRLRRDRIRSPAHKWRTIRFRRLQRRGLTHATASQDLWQLSTQAENRPENDRLNQAH